MRKQGAMVVSALAQYMFGMQKSENAISHVGKTIHKINEKIEKHELERLTDIYHQILLNLNEETNN